MHTTSDAGTPPSAADRAYDYVKDAIITRAVSADSLLAEGQIAEAVGVSRTPVREALLRLEGEGLVRLLPKRGVLVVAVTAHEVDDVLETRRLIEVHAVRKLADAGPAPALMLALQEHLEAMRSALSAADARSYVQADRSFHAELVHAAGNEILMAVYASMRDRQLRMGVVNLLDGTDGRADVDRMRTTLVEHTEIFQALAQGRADEVERAVGAHLEGTQRLLGHRS